jgi:hypothetical protein
MSLKQVSFFIGCVVAWFVLLPLCIAGGAMALLAYVVLGEVSEWVAGGTQPAVDGSSARELARRVCIGD